MMALKVVAPLTTEEKLEYLFKDTDADGNGNLSFKEVKKMISALKAQVTYDLLMQSGESLFLQAIFDKFDKNNDGTVSKEEFVNVLKDDKDIVEVLQKSST